MRVIGRGEQTECRLVWVVLRLEEGGNDESFVLTPRGLQLLSMIDSSIPGGEHSRELLDDQGHAALSPEVFSDTAARANLV